MKTEHTASWHITQKLIKRFVRFQKDLWHWTLKLLHALSKQNIKHFKYIYINYLIQQICNNNNFNYITKTTIARKNNKKNRRRVAFYGISKFDYKVRENLAKRQLSLKETSSEEEKKVESSLRNAWTEVWGVKITTIQTNS